MLMIGFVCTLQVIYVIRNPKDTTVSNWKFLKDFGFHPRYKEWDFFAEESFTEDSKLHFIVQLLLFSQGYVIERIQQRKYIFR